MQRYIAMLVKDIYTQEVLASSAMHSVRSPYSQAASHPLSM